MIKFGHFFVDGAILFTLLGLTGISRTHLQEKDKIVGTYTYSAFYEEGANAGGRSDDNSVEISLRDGQYYLTWGPLRVQAGRVANGFIYKWKRSETDFGEGIYLLYDGQRRLFGTFRLTDQNGEHSGHTKGQRVV